MDSNAGGFHEVEKDGKLILEYYHPKYCPIPQTLTSSSGDFPLPTRFLCPSTRTRTKYYGSYSLDTNPHISSTKYYHHCLFPLFWCNIKEFDTDDECNVCWGSSFGTDFYFCDYCDSIYHRECVESPVIIKHPYHPQHSLQLSYHAYNALPTLVECLCCGRKAKRLVYHCTICKAFMHPTCAMKPIPFVIDHPKKHVDHPLTFFPRQASLTCNVCGKLRNLCPTYACIRCNFVAHIDCMYFPNIMKISRHRHRISYVPSLPSTKLFCGVCRMSIINGDGGAYTCDRCSDYAVHPICATGKDVWDGKELEGVVEEEDDTTRDVGPFEVISEGVILHFLHNHHRLEVSIFYDKNKLCKACSLPIFEGRFYVCMECKFIIHETCAKAPRRIQHALHPHPLTLKAVSSYGSNGYICNACGCDHTYGFVYECHIGDCTFDLDVRCASVYEPFDYKGHKDPLFLALNPEVKLRCHLCERECSRKQLNCIKCDFIVCFECATLPDKARYKHDTHLLTFSFGKQVLEKDWCEVCELNLKETNTKVFYWCNDCYTTFHIQCLFRW